MEVSLFDSAMMSGLINSIQFGEHSQMTYYVPRNVLGSGAGRLGHRTGLEGCLAGWSCDSEFLGHPFLVSARGRRGGGGTRVQPLHLGSHYSVHDGLQYFQLTALHYAFEIL